jgi:hypothetical protein
MRHLNLRSLFALSAVTILAIALSNIATAQIPGTTQAPAAQPAATDPQAAAAQAPTAPPQICGNTAFCYETNDFAATITSFRITTDAAKRQILDLSVRFQNKTAQQLVLGYVNGSGNASDDRGNRLVPWGPNAYRGLGLVYGATFDPKFAVRPAGVGDAQFEFFPQGYPQVVGFTYTLDLSIAEINTFEGNQHTLGEEFPIHFQGLRNGSASVSPGFSPGAAFGQASSYAQGGMGNAMSNPCAAAGNAGGQVASTVSNAANTISSIVSFLKKNKNAPNGQAASIPGCDPNAMAGVPAPGTPMTNAATAGTTATPLQQAVQKTAVPPTASANPLNPLASTPAQPVVNAAQTSTVRSAPTTTAAAKPAVAAAKPATAAKPNPAKPAKPQTQKQPNAAANTN